MLVRVKKGCKGFIYGKRQKEGTTFDLKEGDKFSERWMEKVETEKKTPGRKPKASGSKKNTDK